MKKIMFILMAAFALTITTSCSKKDAKESEKELSNSELFVKYTTELIDATEAKNAEVFVNTMVKMQELEANFTQEDQMELGKYFQTPEGAKLMERMNEMRMATDADVDFQKACEDYAKANGINIPGMDNEQSYEEQDSEDIEIDEDDIMTFDDLNELDEEGVEELLDELEY